MDSEQNFIEKPDLFNFSLVSFNYTVVLFFLLDTVADLTDDRSEAEKELERLKQRVAVLERQVAARNPPNTLSFNVRTFRSPISS